jgi:hypothetical protein
MHLHLLREEAGIQKRLDLEADGFLYEITNGTIEMFPIRIAKLQIRLNFF